MGHCTNKKINVNKLRVKTQRNNEKTKKKL